LVLFGALSFADAKRRLHPVERSGADADHRLPAVRQARALQCQQADRQARDAKLLYLLDALTNCPKAQSVNIYDRCKARYERLSTR
jgi:hypothetical protein